ncbi:unnamed protein product [Aphanomyces euteiches]|uniref:Ion transport domain-containing protein n=1 Tax=Aphanomyces euteiches TaxID=100861 RepID=A0A6G0W6W9_9STRA|nr:hypothetical protein Ae201684_018058 [Aphanomyces euteiches]KAH9072495.1 hypothetical protein Ae201684P_022072 [Aphanomyces euteiches]KAH9146145.1 hypothetical protein AeRB84_009956 [Aphanomyces euteiches]
MVAPDDEVVPVYTSKRHSRRQSRPRRGSHAITDIVNTAMENELASLAQSTDMTPQIDKLATFQARIREMDAARRGGWRRRVRKVLKNPLATRRGQFYHYGMLATIICNFFPMMLETLDGPANGGTSPAYPFLPSSTVYYAMDVFFTAIFALDLGLKLVTAKHQRKFWRRLDTWIDVLGILPLFGTSFMYFVLGWGQPRRKNVEGYLKLLRLFRIIRVTYMLQHVDGIKVLKTTFVECLPPLRITLFFLGVFVMVFATMLFYAEPCYDASACPFTDIFNAGYFAMVTVTTVGYGDQLPNLDNIIAVLLCASIMIIGALYLAMPLAIIGLKYELTWLRFEIKQTSKSRMLTRARSTMRSLRHLMTTTGLPSDAIHPTVHRVYIEFLGFTKEALQLETMISAYMAIPPKEIFAGVNHRDHNEALERLHVACKHVIVTYQKFTHDMRAFEPVQLPPAEPRGRTQDHRPSSLTSKASDALFRAKRAIQGGGPAYAPSSTRQEDAERRPPPSLRRRLRRILERSSESTAGQIVHRLVFGMVVSSVLVFYAETMPEFQAFGPASLLCRRGIQAYCSRYGSNVGTDPGCFVWLNATTVSSTPLSFGDDSCTSDGCFGSGYNFGSTTTPRDCSTLFSRPSKSCKLRQCQPDHVPIADMTTAWIVPETLFAAFFTLELALRLYATKRRSLFLQSTGTWLNVGAIVPYYVEVLASITDGRDPLFAILPTFPTLLTILPVLKMLRVLKLGQHFKASVVLSRTAILAYRRLLIPLFFLFLGCVSAGAIFFEIERGTQCRAHVPCPWWGRDIMTVDLSKSFPWGKRIQVQVDKLTIITDMWRSTWLSIATFTTVGYGDMKPRTPFGRLFDICAMIFGSCYTAMPLSLIGGQFYSCYEQFLKKQKQSQSGREAPQPKPIDPLHHKRPVGVLDLEAIDMLKKCSVVVLLLDEMMQNMVKINQLSPHPVAFGTIVRTSQSPHGHKLEHQLSMYQPPSRDLASHRPPERNTETGVLRRVSNSSNSLFGKSQHRVEPRESVVSRPRVLDVKELKESDEHTDDDKMQRLTHLRGLIQTASTHMTTILLQLTRVMEQVMVYDDPGDDDDLDDNDSNGG